MNVPFKSVRQLLWVIQNARYNKILKAEDAFETVSTVAKETKDPYALREYAHHLIDGIGCEMSEANDKEAIEALKQSAEGGNSSAMMDLAEYFFNGDVVEKKDLEAAFEWARRAHGYGEEGALELMSACCPGCCILDV